MNKPTSKSVSETPSTSSPSGTSEKTENTDYYKSFGRWGGILERMDNTTDEEFYQRLIKVGILTPDGQLTEKYRDDGDEE